MHLHAIDQTRSWEQRRVDGVGRPKFDSTQVGSEGENLYFYRMPGSGLSIYTGNVLVLNKNAPKNTQVSNKSFYKTEHEFRGPGEPMRKRFERVKSEGYDTVHAPQSAGLGQEILALRHAGQPLGKARQRINGNMLVKAGHMRCGQPPDVRVCAPDEPAALLHEACPPWNSHRPGERLTEKHRAHILNEVEGHGIHSCWKGGDDSVMENPMVYFCVEIKCQAPNAIDVAYRFHTGAGRPKTPRRGLGAFCRLLDARTTPGPGRRGLGAPAPGARGAQPLGAGACGHRRDDGGLLRHDRAARLLAAGARDLRRRWRQYPRRNANTYGCVRGHAAQRRAATARQDAGVGGSGRRRLQCINQIVAACLHAIDVTSRCRLTG